MGEIGRIGRRRHRRTQRLIAWGCVVAIAVVAMALAIWATRHGPQVTDDSANYLAGGRNLSGGRGYVSFDLQPMTLFPPGFSATLAVGDKVGIGAVDSARVLNVLAFGALVILTFMLARRHVRREWLAVAAAAAVGLSTPTLNVFTAIWSEPVYCVVAVGLILTLETLMEQRGRGVGLALAAAALASVGFAYRYAGHVLLVLPVIGITMAAWRDGFKAVIRRLAPYVAAAVVVPLLIVARNLSEGSSAFGRRDPSSETLRDVVNDTMRTLREWVFGGIDAPAKIGNLAIAATLALIVVGLVLAGRQGASGGRPKRETFLPIVGFTVLYVAYLWFSELSTAINDITTRLLVPVFAPIAVLVVVALDAVLDVDALRKRQWVSVVTAGVLVLGIGIFASKAVRHAQFVNRSGSDGSMPRASVIPELVAQLRKLPAGTPLYSNDPIDLYFATEHQPISFPVGFPSGTDARYRTRDGRGRDGPVVLAWKEPNPKSAIQSPDHLRDLGFELEAVATVDGWTVYRIGN